MRRSMFALAAAILYAGGFAGAVCNGGDTATMEPVRVHSLNNVPYLAWNLESRSVLGAYLR